MLKQKVNPVGSSLLALVTDSEAAYIFGLWCADGYYRSSSIGITNVDKRLIDRFARFLRRHLPEDRMRMRIYHPIGIAPKVDVPTYPMRRARQVAYQYYVNSRPLLRLFQNAEQEVAQLPKKWIMAYFAGRFDGDGSVADDRRRDLRITYSNRKEAETDLVLLEQLCLHKATVYQYKAARTFVLYISRTSATAFVTQIRPWSVKLQNVAP
ncbi:MAG: LAGLIDADG family homing endonuclease [bacterium]|nr:LAGLIDADG family homing endonuclease [bacterium]